MKQITSIDLIRAKVPLLNGYELSFGTLNHFSTLIVRIDAAGFSGLGEATYLPRYGSETLEDGLDAARRVIPGLIGTDIASAAEEVRDREGHEFTQSALATALETASQENADISIPLVATLSGNSPSEDARDALDKGYSEFKFKVGFDPVTDAERVEAIVDEVGKGALRVDANQGYSPGEAEQFLSMFGQSELQLLEQPLEVGNLESHRELRGQGTPIMLDEDVWEIKGIESISREEAADMVKLKLFKAGSPRDLLAMADQAAELGLKVVIGNGVQTGLGCIHEALIWKKIENSGLAGEMNGFLKMEEPILSNPPRQEGGRLVWPGGFPSLRDDLERFVVNREVF